MTASREQIRIGIGEVGYSGPNALPRAQLAERIVRELPRLRALNFVLENALGGGVTVSLAQDVHGNSLSFLILGIDLPVAACAAVAESVDRTKGG